MTLIKPCNVVLNVKHWPERVTVHASFEYRGQKYYDISVKDPEYEIPFKQYTDGNYSLDKIKAFVLSLADPYQKENSIYHYKIVAIYNLVTYANCKITLTVIFRCNLCISGVMIIMDLRDKDIRSALREHLENKFACDSTTRILEELGVSHWTGRIDMAAVNGHIHGYEIKSDLDTLNRLPNQVELFSKVFDTLTLVCTPKWLEEAQEIIPNWWGIIQVKPTKAGKIRFFVYRKPKKNPKLELRAMVELLWREETIDVLENHGLAKGYKQSARWILWDRLVACISKTELKVSVRERLKVRVPYRGSFRQPLSCDG